MLEERVEGVEIHEIEPGSDPIAAFERLASGASAIGVCGGDGTVAAAASVAAGVGLPLLVLPGGTLNHFAKDLGLDTVEAAVEAAEAGIVRRVDLGCIAGRPFVNNASLGAYPEIVDLRDRLSPRLGKWFALAIAVVASLVRGSPSEVEIDGRRRRVWLAFFGNCSYEQSGLVAAGRSCLDDGLIDVRFVHADRRWARARLLWAVLARRLDRCPAYEAFRTERIVVDVCGDAVVRLAADGETFTAAGIFEVAKSEGGLLVIAPEPVAAMAMPG